MSGWLNYPHKSHSLTALSELITPKMWLSPPSTPANPSDPSHKAEQTQAEGDIPSAVASQQHLVFPPQQ